MYPLISLSVWYMYPLISRSVVIYISADLTLRCVICIRWSHSSLCCMYPLISRSVVVYISADHTFRWVSAVLALRCGIGIHWSHFPLWYIYIRWSHSSLCMYPLISRSVVVYVSADLTIPYAVCILWSHSPLWCMYPLIRRYVVTLCITDTTSMVEAVTEFGILTTILQERSKGTYKTLPPATRLFKLSQVSRHGVWMGN
jgi:hypothetical protein